MMVGSELNDWRSTVVKMAELDRSTPEWEVKNLDAVLKRTADVIWKEKTLLKGGEKKKTRDVKGGI